MITIRSTYLQGASTRSINAKQNSSQIAYQKSTNQISLSKKQKKTKNNPHSLGMGPL